MLGGTSEALALARALEGDRRYAAVYSVAGRTRDPRLPVLACRCGGFGGVEGLIEYLRAERIELLVDATHPFAVRMSTHAVEASRRAGVPLLALRRPAWTPGPADRWVQVADIAAACVALGPAPRRVFLTTGHTDLAAFCAAPQHRYLIRTVEPPTVRPPHCTCLTQRGPFDLEQERALLREHRIEILVTKNSGGAATAPKLAAARECGVTVIVVERPRLPSADQEVGDVPAALDWLADHCARSRPTDLGV